MSKTLKLNITKAFNDATFDAPILILDSVSTLQGVATEFESCIKAAVAVDPCAFKSGTTVISTNKHPCGRLIVSVTGNLNHDYDDARRLYEASGEGINRAIKMGLRKPLLMLGSFNSVVDSPEWSKFPHLPRTVMLGALNSLYVPLEVREYAETKFGTKRDVKATKADALGFYQAPDCSKDLEKVATEAWAIEEGKRVARDIGGSDPIRMTGQRIAEFLTAELGQSKVKIEVVPVSQTEYPMAAAVDRGSLVSPTHVGRIIKLEYVPEDSKSDVFFVGKGITYDTGGHDLKVGGSMALMHRDKCGAAVVAGFFKTLSLLEPKLGKRFVARLACIRNCIGADAYVSDEIITARSGVRVRVNNTDAEGRMVMADLLAEMTELAMNSADPYIFTVATLTGHAVNTYGDGYGAIVTNRAGRQHGVDSQLQKSGELAADMFEISRLRREDWKAHVTASSDEYADLTNSFANRGKPFRGHQSPAAFLMQAAGMDKVLDENTSQAATKLKYTHLDIAGPEVKSCPAPPTAAGLTMLVMDLILS